MSKNRFKKSTDNLYDFKHKIVCLLLGVGIVFILIYSAKDIAQSTTEKQKNSLQQAVVKGAVHCYATQGYYPENIEYLEKHYGISYDKDKFYIDYTAFASNIMPSITVVIVK